MAERQACWRRRGCSRRGPPPGACRAAATRPGRTSHPERIVGLSTVSPASSASLRQAEELFPQLTRRVQLHPVHIKPAQAPAATGNELRGLAHLLTQRVGPGVGLLHLRSGVPFGRLQGRAQGEVQVELMLGPRAGSPAASASSSDPRGQVAEGFQMGRALAGLLPARCQ